MKENIEKGLNRLSILIGGIAFGITLFLGIGENELVLGLVYGVILFISSVAIIKMFIWVWKGFSS